MTQRGGTRIVRFGDDYSYSDIATRRMFGNPTNVEVLEDFDGCLKAASADMDVVAVVPVHNTENGNILGSGGVPPGASAAPPWGGAPAVPWPWRAQAGAGARSMGR